MRRELREIHFFLCNLTHSRWASTLPSFLWLVRIFSSLPGSRLTNFYRDASSALTTRQPMVELYLLTFSRYPLRKKEHKNRTHGFRISRCAGYLLDHSGDEGIISSGILHRSSPMWRGGEGTPLLLCSVMQILYDYNVIPGIYLSFIILGVFPQKLSFGVFPVHRMASPACCRLKQVPLAVGGLRNQTPTVMTVNTSNGISHPLIKTSLLGVVRAQYQYFPSSNPSGE